MGDFHGRIGVGDFEAKSFNTFIRWQHTLVGIRCCPPDGPGVQLMLIFQPVNIDRWFMQIQKSRIYLWMCQGYQAIEAFGCILNLGGNQNAGWYHVPGGARKFTGKV